jgi:folate-dependent phosphoribosylglycinamide formyltransferase PurN
MTSPLPIAWLTTGRGPGSYGALEYALNKIEDGLQVRIAVVFVNRERGESEATDRLIALVERHGVAVETLSSVGFRKERGGKLSKPGEPLPRWRLAYDEAVAERLGRYDFELGVMFGYMLIATEPLYSRFRFINDHPALPDGPVGTYQEVIAELIRSGASESGCMMNVVTGDVDRGAAVSFCRYSMRDNRTAGLWSETGSNSTTAELQETELFKEIRERGVRRERPFLVETLRAIADGTLAVPPADPVDLTAAVEAIVRESAATA